MVIDGKAISQNILDNLSKRVGELHEEGITPQLAVVLIGNDESSKAYVRQKELKIAQIGAAITTHRFKEDFTQEELIELITTFNNEETIHGIIIQRPLPLHIDKEEVTKATSLSKDVDGFCDNSPFDAPIALAVLRILKDVYQQSDHQELLLDAWLRQKKIVILGKGHTAGLPIINYFTKKEIPLQVVDSATLNREEMISSADIIISAVGKPEVLAAEMIKPGAVVIGVGMFRGEDGKMHGDYDEEDISKKASFYTPIPGGVGPVNVAMLLSNLIKASENL